MALVFIPSLMRELTAGRDRVEVEGRTLRQVIDALETAYPGTRARILENGEIRPGLSLAVNGAVATMGLLEKVPPDAEVQIVPAIGGG